MHNTEQSAHPAQEQKIDQDTAPKVPKEEEKPAGGTEQGENKNQIAVPGTPNAVEAEGPAPQKDEAGKPRGRKGRLLGSINTKKVLFQREGLF